MAASKRISPHGLLFFASGSTLLCLLSTLQKVAIGTPLDIKGFVIPFVFGGTTGLAIGFSHMRHMRLGDTNENLQEAIAQLQKSNEKLLLISETLEKRTAELEHAFTEIKRMQGIIPICAECKKIQDEDGQWKNLDIYVQKHSSTRFSHGLCPHCAKKLYPELNIIPHPDTKNHTT